MARWYSDSVNPLLSSGDHVSRDGSGTVRDRQEVCSRGNRGRLHVVGPDEKAIKWTGSYIRAHLG